MGETWMWFKAGNHLSEGHMLCQRCAEETRDTRLLETDVRTVRRPDGSLMTFIFADGPWWREQMRVHPNGWRGMSFVKVKQAVGL